MCMKWFIVYNRIMSMILLLPLHPEKCQILPYETFRNIGAPMTETSNIINDLRRMHSLNTVQVKIKYHKAENKSSTFLAL